MNDQSERPKTVEESLDGWVIFPAVALILESEDPVESIAQMLAHADRCVAAHKHLVAAYGAESTAASTFTDGLLGGASAVAMTFQIIAETAAVLLPAKEVTAGQVRAAFLSLEPRMDEFRARARVLEAPGAQEEPTDDKVNKETP